MRTIVNNPNNYRNRATLIAGNDVDYITKLTNSNHNVNKSVSFIDEYIDENEYCFLSIDKSVIKKI